MLELHFLYKRVTKAFRNDSNPKLKFKIPVIKNKIACGAYNQRKVFIDINEIGVDSELILVVHIRGLKILKQYFYCDCYISQIKVFQNEGYQYNIIPEYSILDDDNENDDIFNEEILKAFQENKDDEENMGEDKNKDNKENKDDKENTSDEENKDDKENTSDEENKDDEENKVDENEMLKKQRIEQLKLEIEKNKAELESLNN